MKLSNPIRVFTASIFLLLFTLQAGLGLYLHNAFHQANATIQKQVVEKAGVAVSVADNNGPSCSCLEDFLVPFFLIEHPVLPQALSVVFVSPQADYYDYLPHSLRIFRSLRAPPVSVS